MTEHAHSLIIDRLGGTVAVAEQFGGKPSLVSNWRKTGIPPARWPALVDFAKEKGDPLTWEELAGRLADPADKEAS